MDRECADICPFSVNSPFAKQTANCVRKFVKYGETNVRSIIMNIVKGVQRHILSV
jgi:hypothetical protein